MFLLHQLLQKRHAFNDPVPLTQTDFSTMVEVTDLDPKNLLLSSLHFT